MTKYSPASVEVKDMFGTIAPKYDLTNTVLSFGMHHLWKQRLVQSLPESHDKRVLDLCTGTGDLLPLLSNRFGSVVGADFCLEMLEVGRKKFEVLGTPFELVQADALNLPFEDTSFDIVSVSFGVRNFKDLNKGLSEILRVLRPGGSILILEFGQPNGLLFGPLYRFYSKYVIPLIGGVLTGNRYAYKYLPETSKNFPAGEKFLSTLKQIGFFNPTSTKLTFGIAQIYKASKP